MSLPLSSHRHLLFQREPPHVPWYANLFRFGKHGRPAPLVTYIGGATGREKYLARSAPAPRHAVMLEMEKALAWPGLGIEALDLLVCPCPLDTGGRGSEAFLEHFDDELVPALIAAPTASAFVGYSDGAAYATHVAIAAEGQALAVFGGCGVARTARDLGPVVQGAVREGHQLAVGLFRNAHDRTADAVAVTGPLTLCEARVFPAVPGDHEFVSYAANGTVAAAFRFVLDRLGSGLRS